MPTTGARRFRYHSRYRRRDRGAPHDRAVVAIVVVAVVARASPAAIARSTSGHRQNARRLGAGAVGPPTDDRPGSPQKVQATGQVVTAEPQDEEPEQAPRRTAAQLFRRPARSTSRVPGEQPATGAPRPQGAGRFSGFAQFVGPIEPIEPDGPIETNGPIESVVGSWRRPREHQAGASVAPELSAAETVGRRAPNARTDPRSRPNQAVQRPGRLGVRDGPSAVHVCGSSERLSKAQDVPSRRSELVATDNARFWSRSGHGCVGGTSRLAGVSGPCDERRRIGYDGGHRVPDSAARGRRDERGRSRT